MNEGILEKQLITNMSLTKFTYVILPVHRVTLWYRGKVKHQSMIIKYTNIGS